MASDYMLAYNRLYVESKLDVFKMESSVVELWWIEIHTLCLIMQTKRVDSEYAAKCDEDKSRDLPKAWRDFTDPAVMVIWNLSHYERCRYR
jgi:hypothetical protein